MPNLDWNTVEGIHGGPAPGPAFVPDTRKWSIHRCSTGFSGGRLRPAGRWPCNGPPYPCTDGMGRRFDPGFVELQTVHPVRGKDMLGQRETMPGPDYNSGWTPRYEPFWSEVPAVHVFENLPEAGADVEVFTQASGDFGSLNEFANVFLNGQHFIELYPPSNFTIPAAIWNALLDSASALEMRIEPNGYVGYEWDSYCRILVRYDGADVVTQDYAMAELCLYHYGYGVQMNGEGFVYPVTITQPDQDREPKRVDGAFWPAKADHQAGVGEPGFVLAAFPLETPPIQEAVFQSAGVWCGTPV